MQKINIPEELAGLLATNSKAKTAFEKLPHSHQQEYVRYIVEAKKRETRLKRSQKAIDMLLKKHA